MCCRLRLNRRFIVVEGISQNLGDVAPLQEICKLKEQYKYRLVVDESLSFGSLGETGRGAAEHFGLRPEQVDIVAASMGKRVSARQALPWSYALCSSILWLSVRIACISLAAFPV